MFKISLSLFLLGLSFGAGPCLASCGPILITYIAGTRKSILQSFFSYTIFSLSRIAVYLGIGLLFFWGASFFPENILKQYSRYIYWGAGIFIILLGLLMALGKNMEHKLCQLLYRRLLQQDKKSIIILGLFIGLLPCAPLLAVFSYVGLMSKNIITALSCLLAFGLGTFISPLALLAVFAGLIPKLFLEKKGGLNKIFNFACAGIMIVLGLQLIRRAF